jgi:hypothetical protein
MVVWAKVTGYFSGLGIKTAAILQGVSLYGRPDFLVKWFYSPFRYVFQPLDWEESASE